MEQMDVSQDSLVHVPKTGCMLTPVKLLLCLLGVAAACTVVGVAVYFGHPDKKSSDTGAVDLPPTAAPEVDPDDPLLPGTMLPDHYDLCLRPDIYRAHPDQFVFSGNVTIHVNVTRATREVTLHQRNLDIHDASLMVTREAAAAAAAGGQEQVLDVSYVKKQLGKEFYSIVLVEELQAGDRLRVFMEFDGPLRNDLAGIYWSSYTDDNGVTKYLVTSQLQSTDARKTFPCFDEPKLKATFSVRLEYRDPLYTIGNMEIQETLTLADGWKADQYGPSPPMSTYLLAFLVSDFACKNKTTTDDKMVYVCARPNAIDQVDYALSVAGNIQDFFEEYHAIDYPLPKTVHVAVPDFSAGAMENWGLIIYRETALLYDAAISSAAYRQRVAVVVSHELAHQWFGNLVTAVWWDDIWLNEGFASYMENLGVDSQHMTGDDKYWQMEAQFVVDALHDVFRSDSLLSSHPVYQPVSNPDQISQVFDGIAYDKGSSVIRMMNYFLGEPTFKKGITEYLTENAYGVTTHTDLFNFLTQEAKIAGMDIDVSEIMNTWILQMGYPVLHLADVGGSIVMEQKRFLFEEPKAGADIEASPYDYQWIIPVTYVTDQNAATNPDDLTIHWLRTQSDSLTTSDPSPKWILGNVGQRFYYRVNYENSNWQALFKQLVTKHTVFSVINRAQLIDDSFSLGRAGDIEQTTCLDAIEYMDAEEDYIPWLALSYNIDYMKRMLQYTPAFIQPLQVFMQRVTEGISEQVGWEEVGDVDADHLNNRLRPLVKYLSCGFGSPACLGNASSMYSEWMSNSSMQPSPNLGAAVSCYGVAMGSGFEEWDFALAQYEASNVASQKTELLRAMGCARNDVILKNYLNMLLTVEADGGKFRDQDATTIMAAVARNPYDGKTIAWTFFNENWVDYIYPTFGTSTFTMASLIGSLTASFSTEAELEALQDFVAVYPDQGTGENAFKQALESTASNIAWRAAHEMDIVEWLKDKNSR